MKIAEVIWIDQVPNYNEISSKNVWRELHDDGVISLYFPVYSASRQPNKTYLLNVVNTVRPNSITEVVKTLQKKRHAQEVEETPILIT